MWPCCLLMDWHILQEQSSPVTKITFFANLTKIMQSLKMNDCTRTITCGFKDTNLGRVEESWHFWTVPRHCICCLLRAWGSDEECNLLCLSVVRRSRRSMVRWWHPILASGQLGSLECVCS